ncbi:MAG: AAA family ATPase [Gammaproteobacteria bacterium]|nr:AAA family ATPase [Gammaproteobacteria bacterium]
MYHDFYQLKENPFNVTADPDFFFSSKYHREAIANLQYGIQHRKGILVVTGEVGTGKTTLCRKLLRQSDRKTKFALILNPSFSEEQLLRMIVRDLGIWTREKNKYGLIEVLNKFLLKQSNKGNNVVVVIDEAQNLSVDQLEQIRLLSNLETDKEKLLQLILVGQPELDHMLQLPQLRQLRQRVAVYFKLSALDKHDVKSYITHRLIKTAANPDAMQYISFSDQAIEMIFKVTQGSPRSINILCDRALLAGFIAETYVIDENIIKSCADEVMYCEYNL